MRQYWWNLVGLFVAGCSNDPAGPAETADLAASKVAVLAIGVATGGEGHAFFDNFLTCPRRGVIDYTNTTAGRRATFTGCDAGDGVVVDGNAEVRWVNGTDRSQITRIEVVGALRVRTGGGSETTIGQLTVTGVSFTSTTEPSVLNLVVAPVRVTAAGLTGALDERASPANVFTPQGRSLDAIPNPTGSLDVLTDTDLKALAFRTAMRLASFLLDETLESQRGEHVHELPCGTSRVTPESGTQLVRIENTWVSCELDTGVFAGGTFSLRWTEFNASAGRITMIVDGQPIFGGNVPRIGLTRYEWTMTALPSPTGMYRVSGRLVAGGRERTFSFDVLTDD